MFSKRTDWNLAPNRFTEAHREAIAAGREVVDLTVSNPARAGFSYDAEAILAALSQPQAMDYDPQPKGLLSAREAVAAYYAGRNAGSKIGSEAEINPESLILTTSTSEGYSYLFRLLCNAGDQILVPKPSYPLFEFLADLQDVKLIPYTLIYDYGWQIDFPSLHAAVNERTRAVVVVHPNNPTGSYASAVEQTALSSFCCEHDLALIVDEVFLDYALDGMPHQTFAFSRDALTFTLSGVSKISGLPQMKLSWIVASGPPELRDAAMARLEVIADTYLSMSAPVQLAAPALLGQRKRIQPWLQKRLRANLRELDAQLAAQKSCTRLQVQGGWYGVARVPVTRPDEELAAELVRQQSVLVHPGHFFDFPVDGYLVLSLITPEEQFQLGVSRMLEFVK